jgi:hypothetical protein
MGFDIGRIIFGPRREVVQAPDPKWIVPVQSYVTIQKQLLENAAAVVDLREVLAATRAELSDHARRISAFEASARMAARRRKAK